jgi:hypothetical protein
MTLLFFTSRRLENGLRPIWHPLSWHREPAGVLSREGMERRTHVGTDRWTLHAAQDTFETPDGMHTQQVVYALLFALFRL